MAQVPETDAELIIHASCISFHDRGLLISGKSGSGKSGLALQLMAFGAQLVSDDRTILSVRRGRTLTASAPAAIRGKIEARGVGILRAKARTQVDLWLMIDMDRVETQRLPEPHGVTFKGISLPCLCKVEAPYFPAAVLQYLTGLERDAS